MLALLVCFGKDLEKLFPNCHGFALVTDFFLLLVDCEDAAAMKHKTNSHQKLWDHGVKA